jgi:uncharacterized protein
MKGLVVRASAIDGRGLFATSRISARRKIGELAGERISIAESRRRVRRLKRIAMVELNDGTAIDASVGGNEMRFVNHSCKPNTYIRIFRHHVEFYSLRAIKPGEELTCDYGETQHEGTLRCRCGVPGCRGFL